MEEYKTLIDKLNKTISNKNSLTLGVDSINGKTSEYPAVNEFYYERYVIWLASSRSINKTKNNINITSDTRLDEFYDKKELVPYLECLEKAVDACWRDMKKKTTTTDLNYRSVNYAWKLQVSQINLQDNFLNFGRDAYLRFYEEKEKGRYWRAIVKANEILYTGKLIEDVLDLPGKICSEKLNSTEC